ncbi:hypothetical protein PLESTB_000831100 [Pleodorina starrii]|uniref:TROVE domain-containing protein n=1 Tax=Pleodorina starrii TaxID=330485 RepID=A0A9W6BL86_9CHLO|nr:hypothetical protein PLESTB_000831100 [Pleodorina starrii]
MDLGNEVAPAPIPQSQPLDDNQVLNNAGGFVYKIGDFARLRRFIILGSNSNNYYVSSQNVTLENCECVLRLLAEGHGLRVVEEVTKISREGRAPRQSTGILVLAVCARFGDAASRRTALAALPAVCRTASTLFEFVQRCKELGPAARATRVGDAAADPAAVKTWLAAQQAAAAAAAATTTTNAGDYVDAGGRGGGRVGGRGRGRGRGGAVAAALPAAAADGKASWGRSMRRAIALWYLDKSPAAVAYQATKYSQRQGWSHADLLRLAHPDPEEHATKRRKVQLAAAAAAAAEGSATGATAAGDAAAAAAEGATAGGAAAGDAAAAQAEDSDWVMVLEKLDEGEGGGGGDGEAGGDGGGAASELGALAAAMAAATVKEADGDDKEAAATAAEAQRVADMKAIFDFLTHGTVPGEERPVRRARRQAAAAAAAGEQQQQQASAALEGVEAAATAAAADGAAVDAAATEPPATARRRRHPRPHPQPASPPPAAAAATDAAATPADTAPTAAAVGSAAAAPLSPVMQYLVDSIAYRKPTHIGAAAAPGHRRRSESDWLLRRQRPPPDPGRRAAHAAARAAAIENRGLAGAGRHWASGTEHVGDTTLSAGSGAVGHVPISGYAADGAYNATWGRMDHVGLTDRPDLLARVTTRLTDARALAAARIHPMTLLDALCTYRTGGGARGVARWTASRALVEALDAGVLLAFQPEETLDQVVERTAAIPMGGTDCALPILHALENRIHVDVFLPSYETRRGSAACTPPRRCAGTGPRCSLPDAKVGGDGLRGDAVSIADSRATRRHAARGGDWTARWPQWRRTSRAGSM